MKNNLTTKLLFSICIFTLINCTSKNNLKENGGIKVDLDSKETTSIFDIFSKIEVIPLETKKEALIVYNPVINSFNIKNDTLFVHCGKSQDVTLFNLANGSFIARLIFLGNGPGEYVTLTDFKINEYTNTLDFLTPQGELLIYDSNDKKQFKDSYQIPVMAVHNFLPISPDGYICSNSSTIKPLLFFSKKDNKEKKEVKAFSKFKEGIQLDRGIISDNALYVLTDPSILNLFTNLSVLDIKNQNIVANINKDEDNLVVLKYTFK